MASAASLAGPADCAVVFLRGGRGNVKRAFFLLKGLESNAEDDVSTGQPQLTTGGSFWFGFRRRRFSGIGLQAGRCVNDARDCVVACDGSPCDDGRESRDRRERTVDSSSPTESRRCTSESSSGRGFSHWSGGLISKSRAKARMASSI